MSDEKTPFEPRKRQFRAVLEARLPSLPAKTVALSFALSCQADSKKTLLESLDAEIARLSKIVESTPYGRREFASDSPGVAPSEAVYQRLIQLRKARGLVDSNL